MDKWIWDLSGREKIRVSSINMLFMRYSNNRELWEVYTSNPTLLFQGTKAECQKFIDDLTEG